MKISLWLLLALIVMLPFAAAEAADVNAPLEGDDKAKFDEILKPVLKIYNFVKYIASVIAVIFLVFAGITYMTSGSDPRKRENAKSTAGFVVIGLLIIWAAPFIVELLIA